MADNHGVDIHRSHDSHQETEHTRKWEGEGRVRTSCQRTQLREGREGGRGPRGCRQGRGSRCSAAWAALLEGRSGDRTGGVSLTLAVRG